MSGSVNGGLPRIESRERARNLQVVGSAGGGGFAQAASAMDRLARVLTAEAEDQAVAQAQQDAGQLALRDETGRLQDPGQRDTASRAGRTFNAAVRLRYFNELELDAARRAVELRGEAGDDPERFSAAWDGWTQGRLAEAPDWAREQGRFVLSRLGVQHHQSVALARVGEERRLGAAAWNQRLAQIGEDLDGLAFAGRLETPEGREAAARFEAHLRDGVTARHLTDDSAQTFRDARGNRVGGLGVARVAMDRVTSGATEEQVLTELEAEFDRRGLPTNQRETLRNIVQSRLADRRASMAEARTQVAESAEDWRDRITRGFATDPDEGNRLARQAEEAGNAALAARIRRTQAVWGELNGARDMPLPELQRAAARAWTRAMTPGATGRDADVADGYQQMLARRRTAMEADPLAEAARVHRARDGVGDLAPLDLSNPDAFAAGLQRRVLQARRLATLEGVQMPALTKGETELLAETVRTGSRDQQAAILRGMSQGLPPTDLPRVLGRLDQNDGRVRMFTVAAAEAGAGRMRTATEILDGMEILRTTQAPSLAGNQPQRTFEESAGQALAYADPNARAAILEAARALYAQRSATQRDDGRPDLAGAFDSSRFRTIVEELVPTVRFNGTPLVVPRRGMTQTQLDEEMARMPASVLEGARAADGRAFTPDMLRRGATLHAVREGTYRVRWGGFDVMGADGGPFLLDLRNPIPARRTGMAPLDVSQVPEDVRGMVSGAAERRGVPVDLALRVAGAESAFRHTREDGAVTTSPAGARGLMQLMPGTARDLGVNPDDMVQNVRGGVDYLKQQLDRFGDPVTAVAAYNWGPENVQRWVRAGADPQRLPAETRGYLQRIFGRPADELFPGTRNPNATGAQRIEGWNAP
jgi:hypothetical protein